MESVIQDRVQRLLDSAVAGGEERGAQVAAYLNGRRIVDACAGVMDPASGEKVCEDSLFPIFSTGKGIAATVIHYLAAKGALGYDQSVADIWPEFAQNGKQGVTVRHILTHTAGLSAIPAAASRKDLNDWERMCSLLAGQRPESPPGAVNTYHAVTYGWLVGEVAHRADGRPFGRILQEDIHDPLGIHDIYFGMPRGNSLAVARAEEPGAGPGSAEKNATPAIPPYMWPLHEWINEPETRLACIPASNGIATARSLARHFAALLPCGVGGVSSLPPELTGLDGNGVAGVAGAAGVTGVAPQGFGGERLPRLQGLGYSTLSGNPAYGGSPYVFGSEGYGGSFAFADPSRGLAVGFTRSLFANAGTGAMAAQAICEYVDATR
ncbi:MAG: beta-lactamase family protein [Clostridiales bacterium]|nr:beta-lactamase family protein [Clostridiales bacterium]